MLPDIGCDDCLSLCQLIQLFDDHRAGQPVFRIAQRIFLLKLLNIPHPFFVNRRRNLRQELFQNFLKVSDKGSVNMYVLIDFRIVDIYLQDLRVLCEGSGTADLTVGKARTQHNQKIAGGYAEIRSLRPVHADHSGIMRGMSVNHAFSHQCITDRRVNFGNELPDFFVCAGNDAASADIDKRLLCFADHARCLTDIFLCILRRRILQIERRPLRLKIRDSCCDIFRNVNENRPRTTAPRDTKGGADRFRKIRYIFYNKSVLGNRHRDAGNVHFLKGILAKQRKRNIAGNRDHGN